MTAITYGAERVLCLVEIGNATMTAISYGAERALCLVEIANATFRLESQGTLASMLFRPVYTSSSCFE